MYKAFLRPLFFLIDAERVHSLVVSAVKLLGKIPGMHAALSAYTSDRSLSSEITVAGLHFNSRVGLAAGFDKNADYYRDFSMFGFGFIEIGTVTPRPQSGNPKPRLFRLPDDAALINRMGFNNKGVDYAVEQLQNRSSNFIIGGNIGKNTDTPNENAAEDYAICFEKLYHVVDYFAINVSCPNIEGMEKLQDINSLRKILTRIMAVRQKQTLKKPVFLKISPDLTFRYIDELLTVYKETGLDGIIATNTTTQRCTLNEDAEKVQKMGPGGLSGKPLAQRSLEIVSYICKQSRHTIPVIGVGGILSTADALAQIRAGANLLQLYTGFIYEGPFLVRKINHILSEYFRAKRENTSPENIMQVS